MNMAASIKACSFVLLFMTACHGAFPQRLLEKDNTTTPSNLLSKNTISGLSTTKPEIAILTVEKQTVTRIGLETEPKTEPPTTTKCEASMQFADGLGPGCKEEGFPKCYCACANQVVPCPAMGVRDEETCRLRCPKFTTGVYGKGQCSCNPEMSSIGKTFVLCNFEQKCFESCCSRTTTTNPDFEVAGSEKVVSPTPSVDLKPPSPPPPKKTESPPKTRGPVPSPTPKPFAPSPPPPSPPPPSPPPPSPPPPSPPPPSPPPPSPPPSPPPPSPSPPSPSPQPLSPAPSPPATQKPPVPSGHPPTDGKNSAKINVSPGPDVGQTRPENHPAPSPSPRPVDETDDDDFIDPDDDSSKQRTKEIFRVAVTIVSICVLLTLGSGLVLGKAHLLKKSEGVLVNDDENKHQDVSPGENKQPELVPIKEADGYHRCPFAGCGKKFKKRSKCQVHMRVHTGERPYACNDCGKKFQQKSTLKRHQLTHTGKREFKCPCCGKEFAQRGNLYVHMKLHKKDDIKVESGHLSPPYSSPGESAHSPSYSEATLSGSSPMEQGFQDVFELLDDVGIVPSSTGLTDPLRMGNPDIQNRRETAMFPSLSLTETQFAPSGYSPEIQSNGVSESIPVVFESSFGDQEVPYGNGMIMHSGSTVVDSFQTSMNFPQQPQEQIPLGFLDDIGDTQIANQQYVTTKEEHNRNGSIDLSLPEIILEPGQEGINDLLDGFNPWLMEQQNATSFKNNETPQQISFFNV
eukprot:m.146030 g.146030  ORF g.146030 m.146030 type:complete len:743 (-) comp14961_c0_seq2:2471-4699(-)